jgi:lauroyl/myristoyl acyltransferase
MTDRDEMLIRRPRKRTPRPIWRKSDIATAMGLAALLLPSWLIPERFWASVWRAMMCAAVPLNRPEIRRNADNIQAALNEPGRMRADAIARDQKAAIYELCMQDLRGWRPGGWQPRIVLEGEQNLTGALARGNGAILWVSPFVFNSGLTKIALHRRGYRVSHLSSTIHGFSQTRFAAAFLNRVRCAPEDRYLVQRIVFDQAAPSTAMRRMIRVLRAGEIVSIVATSTEGSEMVEGRIFGGRILVAVGAPRLAALTGAPLLPVFTVRDPKLGFRVIVEAPIEMEPGRSPKESCVGAIAAYLRRSEPWIVDFPEQWRMWSKWRPATPFNDPAILESLGSKSSVLSQQAK